MHQDSPTSPSRNAALQSGSLPWVRWMIAVGVFAGVLAITGCSMTPPADETSPGAAAEAEAPENEPEAEPAGDDGTQEETCDWESPRISGTAEAPEGQAGELAEVLVGSWQHTHTSEGA